MYQQMPLDNMKPADDAAVLSTECDVCQSEWNGVCFQRGASVYRIYRIYRIYLYKEIS